MTATEYLAHRKTRNLLPFVLTFEDGSEFKLAADDLAAAQEMVRPMADIFGKQDQGFTVEAE